MDSNKRMRLCLIAGCVATFASAAAAGGAPDQDGVKLVSLVRADPQTGRLVRSVSRPARRPGDKSAAKAWAEAAESIDAYVLRKAEEYQVDPLLVRSVIQVESNNDPFAVSAKGAQGLMQLMPATARRFAVKNTFSPWENIDGGVRYLKYLLNLFGDSGSPESLALAAYNAGEGAIIRHGGIPPYRETTEYVRKVSKKWGEAQAAGAAAQAEQAAQPQIEEFIDSRGVVHIQTRPLP
jgi:soluble lytic murein transglycosylase-like protein